jgi:hypothetical protein
MTLDSSSFRLSSCRSDSARCYYAFLYLPSTRCTFGVADEGSIDILGNLLFISMWGQRAPRCLGLGLRIAGAIIVAASQEYRPCTSQQCQDPRVNSGIQAVRRRLSLTRPWVLAARLTRAARSWS